jgi:predicted metal-dependent hydrolase
MSESSDRTITIDGVTLTLQIERKRVKNINARLRDTRLSVSAPMDTPQSMLDRVIPELARKLLRRAHARLANSELDALALARSVAQRFPSPPQVSEVLFVTTQEARWGSYSPTTKIIRLHAALRNMPRWVLESVIAHELAHVPHPDHSPAFWQLVRAVDPDVDRASAFLSGVSWLAQQWERLPSVERALLTRSRADQHDLS